MDRVAYYLGKDPVDIREVNLALPGTVRPGLDPITKNVFKDDILPLLKDASEIKKRKIEVKAFNKVMSYCCFLYMPNK